MSVDPKLLYILRCPVTKQKLTVLNDTELETLNRLIESNVLKHADGSVLDQPLSAALVTENRHTIYKITSGIPVMLENESIPADQIEHW